MEVGELMQLIFLHVLLAEVQLHKLAVGTDQAELLGGEQVVHEGVPGEELFGGVDADDGVEFVLLQAEQCGLAWGLCLGFAHQPPIYSLLYLLIIHSSTSKLNRIKLPHHF